MHKTLEELKNKKFNIKHMAGSFFGGFLVAVLAVYGVSGTQSQGYLRVNDITALNPAALEVNKNIPGVACKVTNCDINAKLDKILEQVTIKSGGNKTLAAYVVEQFTDTRNSFQFLAGQFTEGNNMLTQILNSGTGGGPNVDTLLANHLTAVNSKLDLIKDKVMTIEQYFFPGVYTDLMGKIEAIKNDTFEIRSATSFLGAYIPSTFTGVMNKLDAVKEDTFWARSYMPPVFTDVMNKLNALLAK
ncbi:hypothetical protein IT413_03840 [Candidatus Peregrinibacteria bacterium]|nr:hypothetical protein [Candidatus Peregrinibacteria bacterium]